ncbi:MAG: hypothetical protein KQH63_21660 [Desulfobulbaceae bacterium]|nr:hypothetical protein [Desulfobulbaceae bacterium]
MEAELTQTVQRNCDISDAKDNGIYSLCTLVLKLRNRYKWEKNIEPWNEPESADLLDWIEERENFWETISDKAYTPLAVGHDTFTPWDSAGINKRLENTGLIYGAGYGRSMKAVFFLAEKLREETVEGCPVIVLGKERATELASPFAMLQDDVIYIRRSPLRFFFWDHIQDIQSSSRTSLHFALDQYGLLENGKLNQPEIRKKLDGIVDFETPIFIYHEVGEMLQDTFDSTTMKTIVSNFPHSAVELVARSLKDILADTHPQGMISFIIREKRPTSLAFYVGFLDGLRKVLFPEIIEAFPQFLQSKDWNIIEDASERCRKKNLKLADTMCDIAKLIGHQPHSLIQERFNKEILCPLGLDAPV